MINTQPKAFGQGDSAKRRTGGQPVRQTVEDMHGGADAGDLREVQHVRVHHAEAA